MCRGKPGDMKVLIQYSGPLRTAVGRAEEELDVADDTLLGILLSDLIGRLGDGAAAHLTTASGQTPSGLLIVVNGSAIASTETRAFRLSCGDTIALLPAIAGG
jgi:molybdopterin converting factor small subunit